MQQIADWLEKLGMSEYAERFAENGISIAALPHLTDQDLKDIGVLLGHRRIMLAAISKLAGAAFATPEPTAGADPTPQDAGERRQFAPIPASVSPPPTSPPVEIAGERRYLTVMFCDLVGSTAISAQLDAEEWRDLVGAYLDAASAAVAEMGGHVAKKLGDGLMCLFGYPLAHENDAERAARAALSIQRASAELNRKNARTARPELVARIGLESGLAVLDAAGEIYGDVANIAARVQALAEPGAVLVTARVQRQIVGLFVVEERGSHELKGVPEPATLFRLVRASGARRRSGQRHLTPLVGRDEEIAMLMRRWERALQGEGQLALIIGEPGLGKSRLIEEFHGRLRDTPHTWIEWISSQLLQSTPLHPIADWGRQRYGGADVSAEQRLADLENSLGQMKLDPGENAALLAPLLDIPLPLERALAFSPEELRRRQLLAMTAAVMASARVQPVVLAVEDLHWADPTTLDLLRGIAERGALAPLFVIMTARPEFRPSWGTRSHHGTISLVPLDRNQVRNMVQELAAQHALPKEVIEGVTERTGGVPLFVEEVTRLLLERGEQGGIQAIPPTLQQSLTARLDRLGPAREVAQIGSVVGRDFSYGLLRELAGMEDAALQAALERLAEADIVLVQGSPPESEYHFKHALIQDAAYENLLKSRRQGLHRRVAEILSDRFAATAAAGPEILAHHFTQAGLTDAAIEWWGKAGDQALRRSAFQEAISHLGKAIEMADKESDAAPRAAAVSAAAAPSQRLKLQTSYGQALIWAKGFGADETKAAFARANELTAGVSDATERFATYYGLRVSSVMRGEFGFARHTVESFLQEAKTEGRPREVAIANRNLGYTCLHQGEVTNARAYLEEALRTYNPEGDSDATILFAQDHRAAATAFLALTNWVLGEVASGRALMEKAVDRAVESAHVPTLANIALLKTLLEILRNDAEAARGTAERVVGLAQEHGLTFVLGGLMMCSGWARAQLGDFEVGAAELRQTLASYRDQGNRVWGPIFRGLLAEIEARSQGVEAALTRIDEALAFAGETGEHWTDAYLHRIRGEILLKSDPTNTAPSEEAFLIAIGIAQQQKARSFQLRAALSLAKLYQSTGRPADAHAVLASALESFSPTPKFPEIEQAQTLLAMLAETEEVKNTAALRQRRLKLQTDYGQAMMWSKGQAAEETKAAFARARELTAGTENPPERFVAYFAHWASSQTRGEYVVARQTAETCRREAENEGRATERVVGLRMLGLTCLLQGDFPQAQAHLEEALRSNDPERDRDAKFRFGQDAGAGAFTYLAFTNWVLGQVGDIGARMEEGLARAFESNHPSTQANINCFAAIFEIVRGDVDAARRAAETVVEVSGEHGLPQYARWGALSKAWARARLGDRETGLAELREALEANTGTGRGQFLPLYHGLLAELEAEGEETEAALARTDAALTCARETGELWTDAFLHRIRGEILLKRDPANTAPAEEAFLSAIAIAQQQKARSFELRAALSLAKLYQSTDRPAEAHAFLAPALDGFSPTPEFSEIAEAQALLATLPS